MLEKAGNGNANWKSHRACKGAQAAQQFWVIFSADEGIEQ